LREKNRIIKNPKNYRAIKKILPKDLEYEISKRIENKKI
jgi:hypothetical protein